MLGLFACLTQRLCQRCTQGSRQAGTVCCPALRTGGLESRAGSGSWWKWSVGPQAESSWPESCCRGPLGTQDKSSSHRTNPAFILALLKYKKSKFLHQSWKKIHASSSKCLQLQLPSHTPQPLPFPPCRLEPSVCLGLLPSTLPELCWAKPGLQEAPKGGLFLSL